MKGFIFNILKDWLLKKAYEKVIEPLRKKVQDSESKWDDELLKELEDLVIGWLK